MVVFWPGLKKIFFVWYPKFLQKNLSYETLGCLHKKSWQKCCCCGNLPMSVFCWLWHPQQLEAQIKATKISNQIRPISKTAQRKFSRHFLYGQGQISSPACLTLKKIFLSVPGVGIVVIVGWREGMEYMVFIQVIKNKARKNITWTVLLDCT